MEKNSNNKISKKESINDVFYIVFTTAISVLMFLPIYKDQATLPGFDEEGNEVVANFFYERTPFERLKVINIEWLLYLGLFLFFICLILVVVSYLTKYKVGKYKKIIDHKNDGSNTNGTYRNNFTQFNLE